MNSRNIWADSKLSQYEKETAWAPFLDWCRQNAVDITKEENDWIHFWEVWEEAFNAGKQWVEDKIGPYT
jgi:hypothetical protein